MALRDPSPSQDEAPQGVSPAVAQINQAISAFATAMHRKMTTPKNLAKSDRGEWNVLPLEALKKKLHIEFQEYEVALEYESPEAAQGELVDIANFCMMLHHRLQQAIDARQSSEKATEATSNGHADLFA